MYQGYRIGAVLLMGGSGVRFGSEIPKQFCLLGGKPLYKYALETLIQSGVFDELVLVCHPDWLEKIEPLPFARVISGGATRQESSRAGLMGFAEPQDFVLIHDAVRPFVTKEIILENLEAAIASGAADTCIPTADTLVYAPQGNSIESIPVREHFLRGQTPQTFRFDLIETAHLKALEDGLTNSSDDCRLVVEMGTKVAIVRGNEANLKITSELDLKVAENLLVIAKNKIEKSKPDNRCSNEERRIDIPACEGAGDKGRNDLTERPHGA